MSAGSRSHNTRASSLQLRRGSGVHRLPTHPYSRSRAHSFRLSPGPGLSLPTVRRHVLFKETKKK